MRALRGFGYLSVGVAALLGLLIMSAPASAEALVKFPSAGDPIQGYLTKPKGVGPFPAVVLLHSCLGLPREPAGDGRHVRRLGLCRAVRRRLRDAGRQGNLRRRFPRSRARRLGRARLCVAPPLRRSRPGSPRSASRRARTPRSRSLRPAPPPLRGARTIRVSKPRRPSIRRAKTKRTRGSKSRPSFWSARWTT